MFKIFFFFAMVMASIFFISLSKSEAPKLQGIEADIEILLGETIVQDRLETLNTSMDSYKAFAAVVEGTQYSYGFSFGQRTQKSADLEAFEKCEETRKSKEFNIVKECILLNELIYKY